MVEDADALELALFIDIIKDTLIHDDDISLFPQGMGTFRRVTENVKFGHEFNKELAAERHKSAQV